MSQETSPLLLTVEGMDCSHCATGIENHLKRIGVNDVSVDFATGSAQFGINQTIPTTQIISEIEKMGYHVVSPGNSKSQGQSFWSIDHKFLVALIFTIPLLLHMALPFPILHNQYLQLILTTPVFLIGVIHFGRSALGSLRTGIPNMDVLIVIGITAAYVYSLAGTFLDLGADFLFYETSASIVTFVLLGNVLEKRSIKKTTSAIEELSKIQPTRAKRVVSSNGRDEVEEIDASKVALGDIVIINSGDKIPADGVVIFGGASIDQSMISGESVPVDVELGSKVVGGTLVVNGSIKVRAEAIGEKSVLAHIIRLVKETQSKRPEIQKIGDQVSAYFVPAVLAISLATLGISLLAFNISYQQALLNSIAVLVIACPCAMGLATPTAVMVGIGRAVRSGILVKGGATLESLARVTEVVFDKTGTITTGSFRIRDLAPIGIAEDELMNLVVSLERHSSHPIARSLSKDTTGITLLDFHDVKETRGVGIEGILTNGSHVKIGSYSIAQKGTTDGSHSLYVVQNEKLVGWLDIEDEIREGTRELIAKLHSLNISTSIMSGDRFDRCQAIAQEIGVDHIYADCSPEMKLELVQSIQSRSKVAFVGDGINDAPALAKAEIGISLSNASDVAMQSAQVLLLNSKLPSLVDAILISRGTLRTIKQNLFWAFFYNTMAIPVAACGFLTPMVAALAMAFSDVIVIGNSLRLKSRSLN